LCFIFFFVCFSLFARKKKEVLMASSENVVVQAVGCEICGVLLRPHIWLQNYDCQICGQSVGPCCNLIPCPSVKKLCLSCVKKKQKVSESVEINESIFRSSGRGSVTVFSTDSDPPTVVSPKLSDVSMHEEVDLILQLAEKAEKPNFTQFQLGLMARHARPWAYYRLQLMMEKKFGLKSLDALINESTKEYLSAKDKK
jgi:hypothetical protein